MTVSFGSASYTATEGGSAAAVSVVLSGDPGRAVTIPLTAVPGGGAGGEDYAAPAGVTFASGGALTQTVTVTGTSGNGLRQSRSENVHTDAPFDGSWGRSPSTIL